MRIKNLNLVNTVTAYLFPINREKTNHSKNNALLSPDLSRPPRHCNQKAPHGAFFHGKPLRPRRYYVISAEGKKILPKMKKEWAGIVSVMDKMLA